MVFEHDAEAIKLPKLKQQNLPGGRVYVVEDGTYAGNVYPSITRVLAAKPKPQLEAWKKRVGQDKAKAISAQATRQGTSIHGLVENYLNNQPLPKVLPNVAELFGFLRPWLDKNITKVFRQEANVFSNKMAVAGRFDLLAFVLGLLAVVDFKTSTREKKIEWVEDYFIQGTFYTCALFELTGEKVKRIVLPIVHPTGLQVVECSPLKYFDPLMERIDYFYQTTAATLA